MSNFIETPTNEDTTLCFETETHTIKIEHKTLSLGKKQDYINSGECIDEETGKKCYWIAAFDGHGNSNVINAIRSMNLSSYICKSNPIELMEDYINWISNENELWIMSGSTVTIVKIFDDKICCMNSGDSQSIVFIDGEKIYANELHCLANEKEVERLKQIRPYLEVIPSTRYIMEDFDKMKLEEILYIEYNDLNSMCMVTQSLGHCKKLPCSPEIKKIEYKKEQNIDIVVGSDGLFDMILMTSPAEINDLVTMSASELAEKTEKRWKQDWKIADEKNPDKIIISRYAENDYDDLCVGKISIISK